LLKIVQIRLKNKLKSTTGYKTAEGQPIKGRDREILVRVFAAFGRNCGEPSLAAAARGLLHAPLFAGLGGPTSVAAAAASATPVTVLIVPQPTLAGDVTEGTHGACCIAYDGAAPAARGAALFAAFEHTLRRMAAELDARGDAARWLTVTAGEYGGRHSLQIDAGSDPFVHCFST